MNAVVIAVLIMLILSLLRVNVVFALIAGALAGGVIGGLGLNETVSIFSDGISGGANIALSYALLGGFAVAISYTGIPNLLVDFVLKMVGRNGESKKKKLSKALIVFAILIMSCFSQNVIPIHIAFIPILIPPLLRVMTELEIDRRLIATVITFGLTAPYILLPVGFGLQFHEVIAQNMERSGMAISMGDIPKAMILPVGGMVLGLLFAVFFSYRKPRQYDEAEKVVEEEKVVYSKRAMILAGISIIVALVVQLLLESMIFGALAGIAVLYVSGALKWKEADGLLNDGMKMMAFIGFVMIAASGFAAVLTETGAVESLVNGTVDMIGGNKALAAFLMLVVGLIVTMGIGSSFATIPIITAIFVPLCVELGFSEFATIIIIGTAGALGDAGSPVSDSTLGPTAGLNADGQHSHIWDTCVPTFLHYNIPLVAFGWLAAMIF
ncbi:Na+/H+ antiporter family protein [Rossellomorea sp. RS05]|uniref:Na+/H+ antiporter family protein n=1 Tax=Rossellomorea sp. RS05 TaxID=3149166 RepID=UPI001C43FB3B|nr:Na+/H+ antiporter family protein [Bacillus sp. JRC01]